MNIEIVDRGNIQGCLLITADEITIVRFRFDTALGKRPNETDLPENFDEPIGPTFLIQPARGFGTRFNAFDHFQPQIVQIAPRPATGAQPEQFEYVIKSGILEPILGAMSSRRFLE